MSCSRSGVLGALLAALSITLLVLPAAPTSAGIALSTVVSTDPSDLTPNIVADGTNTSPVALGIWQLGETMYVGGSFHAVRNAGSTIDQVRSSIAAFSASTGALSSSASAAFRRPTSRSFNPPRS